jgi:general secretion pathway protein G
MWRRSGQRGLTLVELVTTMTVMVILAGVAMPVGHTMERRKRELELRKVLREIRTALDEYHLVVQRTPSAHVEADDEGWPDDLEVLVEGIDLGLPDADLKGRFLRRVPKDPMTGEAEWGKRSSKQEPDEDFWDQAHVFDVFSLSEGKALDGTEYKTW